VGSGGGLTLVVLSVSSFIFETNAEDLLATKKIWPQGQFLQATATLKTQKKK
jgi:hypothetical protein